MKKILCGFLLFPVIALGAQFYSPDNITRFIQGSGTIKFIYIPHYAIKPFQVVCQFKGMDGSQIGRSATLTTQNYLPAAGATVDGSYPITSSEWDAHLFSTQEVSGIIYMTWAINTDDPTSVVFIRCFYYG